MSEYQYYEFVALDRPLTDAEYREVRALSTRAQVTRARFVNEYQWGDFRGNPSALMDRYYDAHFYFANWGTRILMIRLPLALLDPETAEQYSDGDNAIVRRTGTNLVLEWRSEDEDGEDWEIDSPSLAALIGVRAELAAGDLRPLYLAWLASLTDRPEWDEADDDSSTEDDQDHSRLEPPCPPGLDRLTAAQSALADFLRVDRDLLAAAATRTVLGGQEEQADADRTAALNAWIKGLTQRKPAFIQRLDTAGL